MAVQLIIYFVLVFYCVILFACPAYGGAGMGRSFEELGKTVIIYCAIGVSVSLGAIAGEIKNSKETDHLRKDFLSNNLHATITSILIFGISSILITVPEISTFFWLFLLVATFLSIFSSQVTHHLAQSLRSSKYARLNAGPVFYLLTGVTGAIIYFSLGSIIFLIAIYIISEGHAFR